MRELLERWAKLEPERLLGYDTTIGVGFSVDRHAHTVIWKYGIRQIDRAVILAAVIEAIEARGWDWTIEHCTTCGHKYTAWLSVTAPGQDAGGDTPAEALLSAYLAAVEGTK